MMNRIWMFTDPHGRAIGASARAYSQGGGERALNERIIEQDEDGFPTRHSAEVYRALSEAAYADRGKAGRYEYAGYVLALVEVPSVTADSHAGGALNGWFLVDTFSNVYKQRDEASGRVALAMLHKNQPELGFVLTRLCRVSGEGVPA
jgi:hypothetical protein